MVDLESFRRLGDDVEREYRGGNYDERAFPDIASGALARWQPPAAFDLSDIAPFMLSGAVPQQPENPFSNLPITLYKTPEFHVECLVWTDATTSIHHHDFGGAFRVLRGSSLHAEYAFRQRERVSALLLTGDVTLQHVELLTAGAVRPITAGLAGLSHSLFHLDQPSMTVVVRTHGTPWNGPQHEIYPPSVSAGVDVLSHDKQVLVATRVITALDRLSADDAIDVWCRDVAGLDFPRIFVICLELQHHLEDPRVRGRVLATIRARHGQLADLIDPCLREQSRIHSLTACRSSVTDPDLRFFLAVLLNVPTRADALRLIGERYPTEAAHERCVAFLAQLGDPERVMGRVAAQMAGDRGRALSPFELRMARARQLAPAEALEAVLKALTAGDSEERLRHTIAELTGAPVERAIAALRQYRSFPELKVLAAA